jgi:MFS family permease
LLALLLGLTLGQEQGFGQPFVLGLFAVWLIFLVAFIVIELRIPYPMIDLGLFRDRQFSVNLGTGMLTFVAIAGVVILMPFYLQNILGYPVRWVGLLMAVVPVMLGIMAPLAGSLSDRFGTRPITVAGLVVLLIGYLAIATLRTDTTALGYVLRLAPIGIGMGIFQSPNNSAIMGSVPRERLGIASGLLSVSRTLGNIIGIAVMGAIWASRVAAHMGGEQVDETTNAPAAVQVAAMGETYMVVVVLVGIALAVAVWAWVQERGRMTAAQPNPQAPVASD